MTTQTEDIARAEAGAEVLRIISSYGDEVAREIFKGYLSAFAHGLHGVTPRTYTASEVLYQLADDHVRITSIALGDPNWVK